MHYKAEVIEYPIEVFDLIERLADLAVNDSVVVLRIIPNQLATNIGVVVDGAVFAYELLFEIFALLVAFWTAFHRLEDVLPTGRAGEADVVIEGAILDIERGESDNPMHDGNE